MKLRLLTFGIIRDITGSDRIELEVADGAQVSELRVALIREFPSIRRLHTLLIAVNAEYAGDEMILTEHDEVALIPPVSGG